MKLHNIHQPNISAQTPIREVNPTDVGPSAIDYYANLQASADSSTSAGSSATTENGGSLIKIQCSEYSMLFYYTNNLPIHIQSHWCKFIIIFSL